MLIAQVIILGMIPGFIIGYLVGDFRANKAWSAFLVKASKKLDAEYQKLHDSYVNSIAHIMGVNYDYLPPEDSKKSDQINNRLKIIKFPEPETPPK